MIISALIAAPSCPSAPTDAELVRQLLILGLAAFVLASMVYSLVIVVITWRRLRVLDSRWDDK